MNGKLINIFDKNPYLTKQSTPDEIREKIWIKDLPVSVCNADILTYLNSQDIETVGEMKWGRYRNENNELTSVRNGDRFIFAKGPVVPIQKRFTRISDMNCRLFHDGQFKSHCKICKVPDHDTGDGNCPAGKGDLDIIPFKSHESVYSNFYSCQINVFGLDFKSSEHAYQHEQAMAANMPELAQEIKASQHAGKAKQLSKRIPKEFRTTWEQTNVQIMKEILVAKFQQVPAFHDALLESPNSILAESTSDTFWASGLQPDITQISHPDHWPGMNMLGKVLMEIRDEAHLFEMQSEGQQVVQGTLNSVESQVEQDTANNVILHEVQGASNTVDFQSQAVHASPRSVHRAATRRGSGSSPSHTQIQQPNIRDYFTNSPKRPLTSPEENGKLPKFNRFGGNSD